jgi:Protein phosphatase 2C
MGRMRVDLASVPGDPSRPNEDFASAGTAGDGGALVVLDGVTPPPEGGDGCVHGVPWYVARLGGALAELALSRPGLELSRCLAEAIERTADAHIDRCDLSHVRTPQATVVAVRWSAGAVEYLVLSDSVLLLDRAPEGGGSRVEPVLDGRLDRLPEPVRALGRAVRALPAGSPERAAARAQYGAAVEALRNTEGGFFTVAADPAVAARAVTGTVAREEVRAVAALTDGATRLVELFRVADWAQTLRVLREEGAAGLVARVRAAESAPGGPARGKAHDDATAVLVEF